MKKRKIASIALACALAVPAVMGLASCGKKPQDPEHTHAYAGDPYYVVETIDGAKKAYSYTKFECGEDSEKTLA